MLLILATLIFVSLWYIFTTKFLPVETYDQKTKDNTGYDERQRAMFLEIFAKTFVGLIYYFLIGMILKAFALYQGKHVVYPFNHFPELIYLLIVALLLISNYFIVKKKFTS
ncbi:hypothetical protein FH144_01325 [Staphylococcus caledonicus]|uniref:hypothetical protein n=1 Tax=Staphylococcus sp. acrmy TaxID=2929076 RepID=UPI001F566450|nr:hypothetical protein [Staphylococcus sp. acrmy]MCI2947069.1 hypothetical protein [Staphylococcus sp. acrmy]